VTDEEFFEPFPEPHEDEPGQAPEMDVPWMPPVHVVGVDVPLGVDVHRGPDVVIRVTRAAVYRRGVELHVGSWVRPGTSRPVAEGPWSWRDAEPRVGFRLADGTRLGHRFHHGPPGPGSDEGAGVTLAQTGGHGGGLRSEQSWWMHPLPDGDDLTVVVRWDHAGVPESSARLDLAALRAAAAGEEVLWDPPPPPGAHGGGWFAHGPMPGEADRSGSAIEPGDDDDGPWPT
jgi:hypothetical protein